jgi:isopentenyl-diphosphate delta-isomerase type 1
MSIPRGIIRAANPDELFNVVDEHDQVVGEAPRREVHAKNLLHRAIHVIIHDHQGHLFLQKRSRAKDTFPGCWDSSCSGHVDAGEDYLAAAHRELGEELGLHEMRLPLRPLLKLNACAETGHEFIQIYLLGPFSGHFDLNPEEISEGHWVSPPDLDVLTAQNPDEVAGALRLLWSRHRNEIVCGMGADV